MQTGHVATRLWTLELRRKNPMKIAILANNRDSFVKPMAEGLQRMFAGIGVESEVFYDGHWLLNRVPPSLPQFLRESSKDSVISNILRYFTKEVPRFGLFLRRLRKFDVIVVVSSITEAYLTGFFRDHVLRRFLPRTPIVLYDVLYLPTRGPWGNWLKEGNLERGIPQPGNWGMERYDWYLCASVVSECPLPVGPQPYSLIGLNLVDGTLLPDRKDEFIALIDFEHTPDMKERAIQILACEGTKTKYIVLNGRHSINEIRKIYRKCSIYFLAMRESFGIPICELQACGSYVFTPYSDWCPSHWLKDPTQEGPGELSPNFVVYDNNSEILTKEINRIKAIYDPSEVLRTFQKYHPQLIYGDTDELKKFLRMIEEGQIHSQSHEEYAGITAPEISASASLAWNLSNSSQELGSQAAQKQS